MQTEGFKNKYYKNIKIIVQVIKEFTITSIHIIMYQSVSSYCRVRSGDFILKLNLVSYGSKQHLKLL